jgi:hypothetical protein
VTKSDDRDDRDDRARPTTIAERTTPKRIRAPPRVESLPPAIAPRAPRRTRAAEGANGVAMAVEVVGGGPRPRVGAQ